MQRVYERSDPEKVSQEALEAAIRDMEALRRENINYISFLDIKKIFKYDQAIINREV